jgi:hypothetical protein
MRELNIKPPSKKASHLPKNAANGKQVDVDAPVTTTADAHATSRKTASKKPAAPAEVPSVGAAPEEKSKRVKKEKVVRDSFTMPKSDYAKIAALKQKCLDAGMQVKKSEVLRAGLLLLEASSAKDLLAAVAAVETVKTGRPAQS